MPSERRSEKIVSKCQYNISEIKVVPRQNLGALLKVHGLNVNVLHSQEHAVFSHLGNCTAMTKAVGGCQYQLAYPLAYTMGNGVKGFLEVKEHAYHILLLINKAVPFMSDTKE